MLLNGDQILGGSVSAKSAALAARHGLRLLRLSSLLVYARSLAGRQQYDLAYNIAKEIRRDAERRHYLSISSGISDLMGSIPQRR